MPEEKMVFVVDDDADVRASVCALAWSMGCKTEAFASADEFLAGGMDGRRGVAVVDLRMPGRSGLELQEKLARRDAHLPVIILTAYARTPTTVQAMKAGAVTLIDKPYQNDELGQAIREAFALEAAAWAQLQRRRLIRDRLATLTYEERLVLDLMVAGTSNKLIARQLGLAMRTVEKRRHDVLAKMEADSVAHLVGLVMEARQASSQSPH